MLGDPSGPTDGLCGDPMGQQNAYSWTLYPEQQLSSEGTHLTLEQSCGDPQSVWFWCNPSAWSLKLFFCTSIRATTKVSISDPTIVKRGANRGVKSEDRQFWLPQY